MISVSPNHGDLFYLRLLLKNKAEATSFDDLKTVNGVVFPDFKGACIELGLCKDDSQWIDTWRKLYRYPDFYCNQRALLQYSL